MFPSQYFWSSASLTSQLTFFSDEGGSLTVNPQNLATLLSPKVSTSMSTTETTVASPVGLGAASFHEHGSTFTFWFQVKTLF